MKKPDYCPEWFDIDLYDNLIDQPRDALCMALWMRQMNYRSYLMSDKYTDIGLTKEMRQKDALEWMEVMIIKWLAPPKNRDNQTIDNYNPLAVEQDIIQELSLRNIADLFSECYSIHPQMRKLFQKAPAYLDDLIKYGCTEQAIEQMERVIKECRISQSYLNTPISNVSDPAVDIFMINLSYSDEVLKMAFEQKLKEIRAKEAAQEQKNTFWRGERTKRFSDAEIRKIVEYRIFAYIDLYVYSLITGRKFTAVEMAAMIYPPRDNTPLDFDAVDRITRTVRPKAIELLERTNPRLLL